MIVFLIILVAVPMQFFLSPASTSEARYHFHKFRNSVAQFIKWMQSFVGKETPADDEIVDGIPAEQKYFGTSLEPRDPRPPYVKFRVGDVVKHKIHGYRGVIIGWDEKAIAPPSWIAKTHKGRKDWAELPNYSIIIDTRDRLIPQLAYVVEENIALVGGRVFHPLIKDYFESFDGKHYIPRPRHKKIYPND